MSTEPSVNTQPILAAEALMGTDAPVAKKTKNRRPATSIGSLSTSPSTSTASATDSVDPKWRLVKSLTDSGEYQRALDALSKNSADQEVLNCRGVCLMRMNQFVKAISPLRMAALNTSTFHLRDDVASHIKVNFAIALFFGGEPSGAHETLSEIKEMQADPSVQMLRRHTQQWLAGMSLLRRFDWYLNRIAPKQGPQLPTEPVGRFVWELNQPRPTGPQRSNASQRI